MRDEYADVFAPARSVGWLSLVALLALLVAPTAIAVAEGGFEGEDEAAIWVVAAVIVPLALFFLITLVSLPRMRYELGADALVLRCGPFLTYRIPYSDIIDITRRNLTPSLWSSMRLPGLALWGVPYVGEGTIYMCATRMAKDIIVIGTPGRRYGCTPADAEWFLQALSARMRSSG